MTFLRRSTRLSLLALAAATGTAHATDYYVSKDGNDMNNGTSRNTPWRTLAKVSSMVYQPGDTINLKRGGGLLQRTWFEPLVLRGSGTPTSPIVVTAYGTGVRPRIAPGTIDSTCVKIDGGEGWKVTDLELSNARWGVELKYDSVTERRYIWLQDLQINNMTNAFNSIPGAEKFNFLSAGIAIRHWTDDPGSPVFLRDLTIKNVSILNSNFGLWTGSICEGAPGRCNDDGFSVTGRWAYVDGFNLENITVTNGPQYGLSLAFMKNGSLTNTVVSNVGYQGWKHGPAGVAIVWTSDVTIDGLKIYNVSRENDSDGCGIDFEGGNLRTTYRNSEIVDTDGSGICVYDNGGYAGPNKDLIIENVDITRFGRAPYQNPPLPNSHGIAFHLTDFNDGLHTGELRPSRFNKAYTTSEGFIGTYQQPFPPTAPQPDHRFWLNNCCDFSSILGGSVTATSEDLAHPATHATDGLPSTYWQALSAAPEALWRDLQGDYVVTRIEQKFNSSAEWRFTVRGTLDWMQWGVTLADYSGGFVGDYAAFRTSGRHHWIVMNFDNPASPIPTSQQFTIFGHP